MERGEVEIVWSTATDTAREQRRSEEEEERARERKRGSPKQEMSRK